MYEQILLNRREPLTVTSELVMEPWNNSEFVNKF